MSRGAPGWMGQAQSLPTRQHPAFPLLGEPQRHAGLSEPSS